MNDDGLDAAINAYALAYQHLEEYQGRDGPLPVGDQKTGCIGEYYAWRYLKKTFPAAEIKLAGTGQKAWDISLKHPNEENKVLIQTKTVSAYSTSKRISPIHHGCHWLLFLYLDKYLRPVGFWIVKDCTFLEKYGTLSNQNCQVPGTNKKGSQKIPFGTNEIMQLLEALQK